MPAALWRPIYPAFRVRRFARLGVDPPLLHSQPAREEPGFSLERQEGEGRNLRYTTHAYVSELPEGKRYNGAAKR